MRSQLRDVNGRMKRNLERLKAMVGRDAENLKVWENVKVDPLDDTSEDKKARSMTQNRRNSGLDDRLASLGKKAAHETWSEFRKVSHNLPAAYIQKFSSTNPNKFRKQPKLGDTFLNIDSDIEGTRGLGETMGGYEASESFRGSMRKHEVPKLYRPDGRAVKFYMQMNREKIFKDDNSKIANGQSTADNKYVTQQEHSFLGSIDPQFRKDDPKKNKLSELKLGFYTSKTPKPTRMTLHSKATGYQHTSRTATTTYTDFKKLRRTYAKVQKGAPGSEALNKTAPEAAFKQDGENTLAKLKRVSKEIDQKEKELAWKQKRDLYSFFDQDFVYDIDRILYPDKYGELMKPGVHIKQAILKEMEHRYRFQPWALNWGLREHQNKEKYGRLKSPSKDRLRYDSKKQKVATLSRKLPNRQLLTEKLIRNRRVIKLIIENLRTRAFIDRPIQMPDDHEVFPSSPFYLVGSKQLFLHVKQDRITKFQEFLEKNRNFIHQYDDQGRSLLHIIIIEKAIRCFSLLMTLKPYLSKKDTLGLTPLDYALIENNTYFIRALLGAGAYPFVRIFNQRNLKERVFSSNAYLVEQAMLIWLKSYFAAKGLVERFIVYCHGIRELLQEIKITK